MVLTYERVMTCEIFLYVQICAIQAKLLLDDRNKTYFKISIIQLSMESLL